MNKSQNAGFTLVEILVGMTIAVIILGSIVGVLMSSLKAYDVNMSIGSTLAPARIAVSQISDHLRYADNAVTPLTLGSGGTDITFSDGTNSYHIYMDGTTKSFKIKKNDADYLTLAQGMAQGLTFTQDTVNKKKMTVQVKVKDNSYQMKHEETISFDVIMPNIK